MFTAYSSLCKKYLPYYCKHLMYIVVSSKHYSTNIQITIIYLFWNGILVRLDSLILQDIVLDSISILMVISYIFDNYQKLLYKMFNTYFHYSFQHFFTRIKYAYPSVGLIAMNHHTEGKK